MDDVTVSIEIGSMGSSSQNDPVSASGNSALANKFPSKRQAVSAYLDVDYLPIKISERVRLRASLIFSFVITTTMIDYFIGISMGANLVGMCRRGLLFQLGAIPWPQ